MNKQSSMIMMLLIPVQKAGDNIQTLITSTEYSDITNVSCCALIMLLPDVTKPTREHIKTWYYPGEKDDPLTADDACRRGDVHHDCDPRSLFRTDVEQTDHPGEP